MTISAIKQFLNSAICDNSAYLNLGHRVGVMRSLLDSLIHEYGIFTDQWLSPSNFNSYVIPKLLS